MERKPGESTNDRNDRAIRRAAAWYAGEGRACSAGKEGKEEGGAPRVVLVTDDAENRKRAENEGGVHQGCYSVLSIRLLHAEPVENPKLNNL